MNLLSLILIAMGIIAAICVFYAAWQFSSGRFEPGARQEPDPSIKGVELPGDELPGDETPGDETPDR